jgi:cell division septal protein FtsQ
MAKLLARLLVWGGLIIVILATTSGVYLGMRHILFTGNDHFTLRQLDIEVIGHPNDKRIAKLLENYGLRLNQTNLFAVKLAALRDFLLHQQEVPIVDVVLTRRLPETLSLKIFERRPIAQVGRRGSRYLDEDGWVLPQRSPAKGLGLPVITGIRNKRTLKSGTQTEDHTLLAALKLLRELATRANGRLFDISLIQLNYSANSLTLHLHKRGTFREGARVILPIKDLAKGLERVVRIATDRQLAEQTTSFIDATYETNVPTKP